MIAVCPLLALSELLVDAEMTDTLRKARSLIKSGDVYVEDIRVATDALVVISHPTRVRAKEVTITVYPKELNTCEK